jgi:L-lactate dehydrogenase complex protein LldG
MSEKARTAILTRLRQARPGLPRPAGPIPPATRPSPPADFATFAAALAGQGVGFDLAPDAAAARRLLAEVMARHAVKTAVAWDHPDLEAVDARSVLDAAGAGRLEISGLPEPGCAALAEVDMGLSGVDWALAATGSLVLAARPGQRRAVPLVPRLHLALVARSRLLPDLATLLGRLGDSPLPSALSCVSGVSSTGDIEFVYVRGVHGPLAVHVIGLDWR